VSQLLQQGPPLPRASVCALALPVLQRAAAQFAGDAERHRDERGALASLLAVVFAASDAPAHTAGTGIEAVFEGGLFDFAWSMLFRNKDFGHYTLADGQQPPAEALVAMMTCVAALPTVTLESAFTPARVALAHATPSRWRRLSGDALAALGTTLARFAEASPAAAGQLLERGIFLSMLKMLEGILAPCYALQIEISACAARRILHRLDLAYEDAPGAARMPENLSPRGAVECCVAGVAAAVFGGDALGDDARLMSNVTDVLLTLRKLAGATGDAFSEAFANARGPQLLDLLRYNACTQQDGPTLRELTQLQAQLESIGITLPATLPEEQRCSAATDLRVFTKDGSVGWEAAFDAHLACSLEEGGHPRRGRNIGRDGWAADSAPERAAGAPSAAALALLQARARERVLFSTRATIDPTDAVSLVVLQTNLRNPLEGERAKYRLLIAPDDARLPSHAMHFRAASDHDSIGWYVHRCFRPPEQPAGAALPYLTIHSKRAPCATGHIAPVPDDIVYGEHAPVAADAEYAPGTVLVRPWSVRPAPRIGGWGASDLPMFLVYQPCAASLLPGAVPVGRVSSCSVLLWSDDEEEDAGRDRGGTERPLFDDTMLACLTALAGADSCGGNDATDRWSEIGLPYFHTPS